MRRWFLLVVVVIGCQASDRPFADKRDSTTTQIPGTSRGIEPLLSIEMRRALSDYAPGFTTFSSSEYAQGVETSYRAEGDFNGDGILDLALYGHDQERELLFVILSSGKSRFNIVPLVDQKLIPFEHGVSISLRPRSAGLLDLPQELAELDSPKPPSHLRYTGIDVVYGNQAGELYYWNGSQFVKVLTGD